MMDKEKHNPVVKNRARRMVLRALAVFMGIAAVLASCQPPTPQADKRLLAAETVMQSHPDSALHLLQAIPHPEKFKGLDQGLYALLRTQAAFKNGIPVASDSLITIAVDYFSQTPDSLRKAWSCFYAGQVYRDLKETEKALGYFHQAASAGEQTSDLVFLYLIHYHIGRLLQDVYPYDESVKYLKKAIDYADRTNNPNYPIDARMTLGWTYLYKDSIQTSRKYFKDGIFLAQKTNNTKLLLWLYQKIAMTYYLENKNNDAIAYLNKSFSFKPKGKALRILCSTKTDILLNLHQYDSAMYYAEQGFNLNDIYGRAGYNQIMSSIAEKTGKLKESLAYQKLYSKQLDSINRQEKDQELIALQKKYDVTKVEYENMRLKSEKQHQLIITLSIILFLIGLIIIGTYLFRIAYRKFQHRLNQKEKIIQNKQAVIAETETLLIKHEQQEKEMRKKIVQKDKLVEEFLNQKRESGRASSSPDTILPIIQKHLAETKKTDIKLSKCILSEEELSCLTSYVDAQYNNFASRLQLLHTLSGTDLYICCLLKLGIKPKEIELLLNLSGEALKKRCQRLCKTKLNISSKLEEFIRNF